ncbi:MAG: 3-dehydroquinate synthase [Chlorobi bacterium]|nr:3-dehydroquinate synthase [Chlorobiota bacterium]
MHPVEYLRTPVEFVPRLRELASRATKLFILTDSRTRRYCLPILGDLPPGTRVFEIPPGENSKSPEYVSRLWDAMFDSGADRKSVWINLGGGVVSDLGGFAASTYKRGIPYYNIPTSLLAMTDAALGGKTGINYRGAKNQIGTIVPPRSVWIYPPFVHTLPRSEFMSGLAEMLKHGLIADANYFRQTAKYPLYPLEDLIRRSVEIKSRITEADPHEGGMRQLLNFGHTFGHALEAWFGAHGIPLTHGHAVALGMMIESLMSVEETGLPYSEYLEIRRVLESLYDPSPLKRIPSFDALLPYMRADKKNTGDRINFVLLERIGKAVWNRFPGEERAEAAFEKVRTEL